METATLVAEAMHQFAPTTNHYRCSDGRWLLVTVIPPSIRMFFHTRATVHLADQDAQVLDADGDPSNGMTPLETPEGDTHDEVLAALGYTVITTLVTAAPPDSLVP